MNFHINNLGSCVRVSILIEQLNWTRVYGTSEGGRESVNNATTATPSDVKLNDYVAHGEMERVPRVNGCFRPTKGNFGR